MDLSTLNYDNHNASSSPFVVLSPGDLKVLRLCRPLAGPDSANLGKLITPKISPTASDTMAAIISQSSADFSRKFVHNHSLVIVPCHKRRILGRGNSKYVRDILDTPNTGAPLLDRQTYEFWQFFRQLSERSFGGGKLIKWTLSAPETASATWAIVSRNKINVFIILLRTGLVYRFHNFLQIRT